MDWIDPWADEKAGSQEIVKFYYTASAGEPGPGLSLALNRTVFDELPAAHQQMIEQVAMTSNLWTWPLFGANNAAALQRLQQAGIRTLTFPGSVWNALGAASQKVYQEYMGDDL